MTYTTWTDLEAAGFLPVILQPTDARPAREQLADRYAHGGGYNPIEGNWRLSVRPSGLWRLTYPGTPKLEEVSRTYLPLSKELLVLFQCSFLAIVETTGLRLDIDEEPGPFVVVRVD